MTYNWQSHRDRWWARVVRAETREKLWENGVHSVLDAIDESGISVEEIHARLLQLVKARGAVPTIAE